ncbi:MAG: Fe-S protein assembly co-chaperone HscB [Saprospiraceae bacterium]|nr:Fe-S protein assembly co-chaperone HscB [Saprospiraceae bacterium]
MNYFDFFGLPVSFQVDPAALRSVFLQNSRKYHPDFHTLSDEARQASALEMSTLNNEAFKTLSDMDRRIRYILEINDLLGSEDAQPPLPASFLGEMMDINEALMELEFDFDETRYQAALHSVQVMEQSLVNEIQPILEHWTAADGKEPLLRVRDYFLKKRYLLRIHENLSKFAPRLK